MTKAKKPFSYKDWYRRNRHSLNERRREKYNTNPAYRARIRRQAQESYAAKRNPVPVDRRTIVDKTGRKYWSIGRIARLINRKVLTVRQYHKTGVLPQPTYFDSRGWRLYTPSQAALLRMVFRRLDDPNDTTVQSLADVTDLVIERWDEE